MISFTEIDNQVAYLENQFRSEQVNERVKRFIIQQINK